MDKIVVEARKLLGEAVQAISGNDRYNAKHPYEASFPNGARDHIRMILENIIRLDATKDRDKAIDTLAYCALYVSWMRAGQPQSEFKYIANRYMNLLRVQEKKIDLREMRGDEDNSNGGGFGTVSDVQRDG